MLQCRPSQHPSVNVEPALFVFRNQVKMEKTYQRQAARQLKDASKIVGSRISL